MQSSVRDWLAPWSDFYLIVGSAAAGLTGLQFVVVTLVAESRRRKSQSALNAFGSPTIVHFCAVLLLSGVLTAPWTSMQSVRITIVAAAVGALGYVAIVTRRARRQRSYEPVFEDWLTHVVLPGVSYAAIAAAGSVLLRYTFDALFVIAAMSLMLMFVGIHNAWDSVTYVAVEQQAGANAGESERDSAVAHEDQSPATSEQRDG